jgi:hypothetical protein
MHLVSRSLTDSQCLKNLQLHQNSGLRKYNMAEEGKATKLAEIMEVGRGACKSNDISATLMRKAVTPNNKQQSKREQEAPKKLRSAMKKGLKNYFGQGKRSPIPSTAGNLIATVVQRPNARCGTPMGKGGNEAGEEGEGDKDNTKWLTPITKKGSKSLRSASNENGQNKKPRSDNEESEGEESKQKTEEEEEQAGFVVDHQ